MTSSDLPTTPLLHSGGDTSSTTPAFPNPQLRSVRAASCPSEPTGSISGKLSDHTRATASTGVSLDAGTSTVGSVTWTELFFDLPFVVVLGELGECYLSENNRDYDHYHDDNGVHWGGLQEDKTPHEEYFDECFKKSYDDPPWNNFGGFGVAHILLVFIPIWLFWVQVVNLAIRFQFGRDAVYSEALFYMVAITLVACLNMDLRKVVHYMQIMHREETDFPCNEFDTYKQHASPFMFVYASMRLLLALTFFVLRLLEKGDDDCVNKNKRRYMSFQSGINFAVFAIWICISLAPNPAIHDVLWVSSIAVDFFHAYLPHLVMKGHKMAQMIDAVPIDAGLYSERFGLFVIIAMGEVVVGCSQEEPPEEEYTGHLAYAYIVRAFVILTVYVVKLAHFDAAVSEASLGSVHPVVRGGLAADVWTLAHAPLALALVVLGAVVKRSFSIMKISVQDCNIYNFSLVVVLLSGATIFGSWGSKGERGWLRKR
ncbi:hypothetical protein TeGR_g2655, partial [Tetraparma gracilis]